MSWIVVRKNKDKLIPGEFLKLVLKEHNQALGIATVVPGSHEVMFTRQIGVTVGDVHDTQKAFENHAVAYIFGKNKPKYEEDIPPFEVLTNGEGKPILMAMLNGDFNMYRKERSEHTPEFFFHNEYMVEKLRREFRLAGNNIEEFMKTLEEPILIKDLLNACGRGTIMFLSSTGQFKTIEHNDGHRSFPWGTVSDHLGYVEPTVEKPAIKGRIAELIGKVKVTQKTETVSEPQPNVPVIEKPPEKVKQPDTSVAALATAKQDGDRGYVYIKAPEEIKDPKALQKFYRNRSENHICPENYMEHPEVPVLRAFYVKKFPGELEKFTKKGILKDFSQLKDALPMPPVEKPPVVEQPQPQEHKPPTEPVKEKKPGIMAKMKTAQVETQSVNVPIISAESKKKVEDIILNRHLLDQSSQKIMDPKLVAALESKYPTFAESVGLSGLEDTFRWLPDDLLEMVKEAPEAIVVLLMNYRTAYVSLLKETGNVKAPAEPSQEKKSAVL